MCVICRVITGYLKNNCNKYSWFVVG